MIEELCLVDSNILIRWVQPADPDYPIVEAALSALVKSGVVLCYTSQNLAEFWNASTRPAARNGYGLSPAKQTGAQGILNQGCGFSPTVWQCMRSGAICSSIMAYPAYRCMTPVWSR